MQQQERNQLIIKLMNLLKTHDWNYQYSDDHRVWSNGSDEAEEITKLVNLLNLSKEDIEDLTLQYPDIKNLSHRYNCYKNPIFTNAK